jgi:hypothetical protein
MAAAGQRVLANFTARRSGSLALNPYPYLAVFFVVSYLAIHTSSVVSIQTLQFGSHVSTSRVVIKIQLKQIELLRTAYSDSCIPRR